MLIKIKTAIKTIGVEGKKMINAKLITLGLLCLFFSAYANAELTLIKPTANSTTEINIFQGQNATIDINIQNTGNTTITGIIPQTDLNAEFSQTKFGLDPGKTKTTTATIYTNENTTGTITINEQSFRIKIKIIQEQNIASIIKQKIEENKDTMYAILLMGSTIIILLLLMRKS